MPWRKLPPSVPMAKPRNNDRAIYYENHSQAYPRGDWTRLRALYPPGSRSRDRGGWVGNFRFWPRDRDPNWDQYRSGLLGFGGHHHLFPLCFQKGKGLTRCCYEMCLVSAAYPGRRSEPSQPRGNALGTCHRNNPFAAFLT